MSMFPTWIKKELNKSRKKRRVTLKQMALKQGNTVQVTFDDGHTELRIVKYEPWRLENGEWLVGIEGITGGYSLSRCEPGRIVPAQKNRR